jgi:hypothetical protein
MCLVIGFAPVRQACRSQLSCRIQRSTCFLLFGKAVNENGGSVLSVRQSMFGVDVPRGSMPTMSNRLWMAGLTSCGKNRAKSVDVPPGPPGLTNRVPILRLGSAAGTLSRLSRVFSLLG